MKITINSTNPRVAVFGDELMLDANGVFSERRACLVQRNVSCFFPDGHKMKSTRHFLYALEACPGSSRASRFAPSDENQTQQ